MFSNRAVEFYQKDLDNILIPADKLEEIKKIISGQKVIDFLYFLPRAYNFWQNKKIIDCQPNDMVIIKVKSLGGTSGNYSRFTRVVSYNVFDDTGLINISYFNISKPWMKNYFDKTFKEGKELTIYAKISKKNTSNQNISKTKSSDNLSIFDKSTKTNDEKYALDNKTYDLEDLQILHPLYIFQKPSDDIIPKIEPIYSLPKKFKSKDFLSYFLELLKRLKNQDWYDREFRERNDICNLASALKFLHQPSLHHQQELLLSTKQISEKRIKDDSESSLRDLSFKLARDRLVFDEVFISRLVLENNISKKKMQKSFCYQAKQNLLKQVLKQLPFQPTNDQDLAIKQIYQDLSSGSRMIRLVLGDVGSGKTLVAVAAAMASLEAGCKVAIMTPTDILASQHYKNIEPILAKLSIKTKLLRSRTKKSEKTEIYKELASKDPMLVIGTQALIANKVWINNLGLVVIDEQHKFGVKQRMKLGLSVGSNRSEGNNFENYGLFTKEDIANNSLEETTKPHILLLSATPIPRSLLASYFGNIDVTQITEMPKGRKSITTKIIPNNRISDVCLRLNKALTIDQKAFWICPLVIDKENSKKRLSNVHERFSYLTRHLSKDIELFLLHGKLKKDEKQTTIESFIKAKSALMVATTIVEVGIDIKEATIIIIEDAQNFGIAQLHQLRGRVGRGDKQSSCLMIYKPPLNSNSIARLEAVAKTNSGYELAKSDLEIRGGGNIIGLEQSGVRNWRFFNFQTDKHILAKVDRIIKEIQGNSEYAKDQDLFNYFSSQIDFSAG